MMDLPEIANAIHDTYKKASGERTVDKEKLKIIVEAFYKLYQHRSTANEEHYYIGNLISSGNWEGTIEEIIGTVEQAVKRTLDFIEQSKVMYPHQGEIISRNFLQILRKESFTQPEGSIVQEFIPVLKEIAEGKI